MSEEAVKRLRIPESLIERVMTSGKQSSKAKATESELFTDTLNNILDERSMLTHQKIYSISEDTFRKLEAFKAVGMLSGTHSDMMDMVVKYYIDNNKEKGAALFAEL